MKAGEYSRYILTLSHLYLLYFTYLKSNGRSFFIKTLKSSFYCSGRKSSGILSYNYYNTSEENGEKIAWGKKPLKWKIKSLWVTTGNFHKTSKAIYFFWCKWNYYSLFSLHTYMMISISREKSITLPCFIICIHKSWCYLS